MNAMCACRSARGQLGTPWPRLIVFIIKMYFTTRLLEFGYRPSSGANFARSSSELQDSELAAEAAVANCRTSIGMLVGMPPGPGAAEIRPAMAYARSGVATSTIQ